MVGGHGSPRSHGGDSSAVRRPPCDSPAHDPDGVAVPAVGARADEPGVSADLPEARDNEPREFSRRLLGRSRR